MTWLAPCVLEASWDIIAVSWEFSQACQLLADLIFMNGFEPLPLLGVIEDD